MQQAHLFMPHASCFGLHSLLAPPRIVQDLQHSVLMLNGYRCMVQTFKNYSTQYVYTHLSDTKEVLLMFLPVTSLASALSAMLQKGTSAMCFLDHTTFILDRCWHTVCARAHSITPLRISKAINIHKLPPLHWAQKLLKPLSSTR